MKRFTALVYWFNVYWIRALVWLIVSKKVIGLENLPRRDPFLLVSNHLSNVDPFLIAAPLPRRMAWLTKVELFKIPFVGFMFRLCGMVPIRRFEADRAGLREALKTIKEGVVLGVFPEGTRSLTVKLQRGHEGTAYLALKAGVPIVPVAIWGTESVKIPRAFFRRNRGVQVHYGRPFTLERKNQRIDQKVLEEGTEKIMEQIAALLPQEYRGVYG